MRIYPNPHRKQNTSIPTIGYRFIRSCRTVENYLNMMAVVTQQRGQNQPPEARAEKIKTLYESLLYEIRRFKIKKRPGRHHEENQPSEELMEPADEHLYFFEDYMDLMGLLNTIHILNKWSVEA